jgi:hypothetical protein
MNREQLTDYLERASATAVQAGAAAAIMGVGWKAAAVAGIGAGLAVIKAAAKQRLAQPKVES